MNENTLNKNNLFNQIGKFVKKNLNIIIFFLSICFIIFLSFQIYNFYSTSKIKKNSITFFNTQNLSDQNIIQETILKLSKENNFYSILSKLELIQLNFKNENYEYIINLYKELLSDNNLDSIYKSAIASRASYQFINVNLIDISENYTEIIEIFISHIDDELINYQGVKLELTYLVNILKIQKDNIQYLNFNEIIDLYNNIMSSDVTSSNIKERVNKIHEFFSYK